MKSSIGRRIHDRRVELGFSADKLAAMLGKNRATIYRYESDDIENMPTSIVRPLADALQVSPAYLMGWTDNEDQPPADLPSNILPIHRKRIPLLGSIAAGEPIYADQDFDTYIEADSDIRCDYALKVDGDSMEPTIHRGDIVFIRKQDDVDNNQIAAVLIDDSATLKRVTHIPDGLLLISDNMPKYAPRTVTFHEFDTIRILGRAVAFKRIL